MAEERITKYLLDLDGVKTLYDEILKDAVSKVGGSTISVNSYDDIVALTDSDLQDVNTVILVYD